MSIIATFIGLFVISLPGYIIGRLYSDNRLDHIICSMGLAPGFSIFYAAIPMWFGLNKAYHFVTFYSLSILTTLILFRPLISSRISRDSAIDFSWHDKVFMVFLAGVFLIPAFGIPYTHMWNETWIADEDLVFHILDKDASYKSFFTDISKVSEAIATSYYPPLRLCLLYTGRIFDNTYGYSLFAIVLPFYTWVLWIFISIRFGQLLRNKSFAYLLIFFIAISPGIMGAVGVEWNQDLFLIPLSFFLFYNIYLYFQNHEKSSIFLSLIALFTIGWIRVYVAILLIGLFMVFLIHIFHENKEIDVQILFYFLLFSAFSMIWPALCIYYHHTPFFPHQVKILGVSFVHPDEYIRYIFFQKYFWGTNLFYKFFVYFVSNFYFSALSVIAIPYAAYKIYQKRYDPIQHSFSIILFVFFILNILLILLITPSRLSQKFIFPMAVPMIYFISDFVLDMIHIIKERDRTLGESIYRTFLFILTVGTILNIIICGAGKVTLNWYLLDKLTFKTTPSPKTYGKTNLEIADFVGSQIDRFGQQSVLLFLTADFQGTFAGLLASPERPLWSFNFITSYHNRPLHHIKNRDELLEWLKRNGIRYVVSWADKGDFERRYFKVFVDDAHPGLLGRMLHDRDPHLKVLKRERDHFRKFALYEVVYKKS